MPTKPKAPCRFSGCPKLTSRGYCDEHYKLTNHYYNKYKRDPKCNKRYGSRWKKVRKAFLKSHPICELCSNNGKLTPTVLVHHKQKLSNGGTNDYKNLQALCQLCHSSLHAKQNDRWQN